MNISNKSLNDLYSIRLNRDEVAELAIRVSCSKNLFDKTISTILNGTKHEAFMASWVLGYAGIYEPAWFYFHLPSLLNFMEINHNESVLRSIVRVIRETDIPEEMEGLITLKCIEWLENKKSSIAVRAFSLHVLSKIIDREPALCHEIKDITESVLPYASAGLANAAEKLLKKIQKIKG